MASGSIRRKSSYLRVVMSSSMAGDFQRRLHFECSATLRSSRFCNTFRNPARVQQTVDQLSSVAKEGKVSSYTYDLASLSQTRQFAEAVKAEHKTIDVLINNAGVYETKKCLSEDGFELTWAVNVLAPFLLTSILKDIVTERIVNVSSISAGSRIDFDNLQQVRLSNQRPMRMICARVDPE